MRLTEYAISRNVRLLVAKFIKQKNIERKKTMASPFQPNWTMNSFQIYISISDAIQCILSI